MHLDLDDTVALARLAPAPFDVEAEPTRFVATRFGLGQTCEPVADRGKRPGIGRGVRPRCASDGPLVNVDDLVEMLQTFDRLTRCRRLARTVQAHGSCFEQGLNGQSGLAASRHTSHANKLAQRELSRHVLQVISSGFDNLDRFALLALAAFRRDRNLARPTQVLSGERCRVVRHSLRRALRHNLPAMHTCARTNVKDVIRLADRLFVMFNDDHRVALIAERFERAKQAVIVTLVQTDGRFIQHIKNASETRPNLRRQADALAFAPGQGACVTRQRQVFETHIVQESKTFADLLEDRLGDFVFLISQVFGNGIAPLKCLFDGHLYDLTDVHPLCRIVLWPDLHRQRFFAQAIPVAGAARPIVLVSLKLFADPVAVRFAVAPFHVWNDTFKGARDGINPPALVIAERDFFVA